MRVQPQDYNAFIAGLEPREIRLTLGQVEASEPYHGGPLEADIIADDVRYVTEEQGFRAIHSYVFEGRHRENGTVGVMIKATFEIAYASQQPITDDIFDVFSRVNLPVNSWPFFREYVHSTLARVGWPTTVLPAFKVGTGVRARKDSGDAKQ